MHSEPSNPRSCALLYFHNIYLFKNQVPTPFDEFNYIPARILQADEVPYTLVPAPSYVVSDTPYQSECKQPSKNPNEGVCGYT